MRPTFELTPEEFRLLAIIDFQSSSDPTRFEESAQAAAALTILLLERNAIPRSRIAYFIDPDCNIAGRGRSRRDGFERRGVRGDAIFRHGHFLKYLYYFLYGANLPDGAIAAFGSAVEAAEPVTSGDIEPLQALACAQARAYRLNPKEAAEEFFKLSLDCELSASEARFIRDAVMRL